jgi:hypothetical protein
VLRLVFAFVEIALHRRGPEQLPASQFLFAVVLATYLVVALLTSRLLGFAVAPAPMVFIETALQLAFIWCLLRAFERNRRFTQTACAVVGADTLINVLRWPLIFWDNALAAPATELTLPQIFQFLLWVWSIDISSSILARALDRPYVLAVAIVIGYVMLSVSLRVSLFPPVPAVT